MIDADLIRFFTDQGLTIDPSGHHLQFSKPAGNGEDGIDNLQGDPVEGFSIWRVPRKQTQKPLNLRKTPLRRATGPPPPDQPPHDG